ncbi:hypothetical protein WJX82_009333 [Trebouxia sp. C0006]
MYGIHDGTPRWHKLGRQGGKVGGKTTYAKVSAEQGEEGWKETSRKGGIASILKSAARLVEQATANKAQHAKAVEEANTLPPEQTKVCKTTSTTGSLTCGARLPLTAFTKRRSVCKYCTTRTREAKEVAKLDKKGKADEQEEQERI